jgi:hypothetical protein
MDKIMNKCELDHFLFLWSMPDGFLTPQELVAQQQFYDEFRIHHRLFNTLMQDADRIRHRRVVSDWRRE